MRSLGVVGLGDGLYLWMIQHIVLEVLAAEAISGSRMLAPVAFMGNPLLEAACDAETVDMTLQTQRGAFDSTPQ